jgi:hypothetical protein
MATRDEAKQEIVLRRVLSKLRKTSFTKTPPEIADGIHYLIRTVTKNPDPYKKVKERYNRIALAMYPNLKRKVAHSRNRLLTATRLAIAGNIIDFGPGVKFDIEKTVREVLVQDFAINNFDRFKRKLDESSNIIYVADNAGEIVFDRILLEELEDKKITFVVKGGPVLNDATIEDARSVGINKIAKIARVSNGAPGTGPKRNSKRFINWLKNAEVVISKGQGNYEALSEVNANIFFLLKIKCPVIARDLGAKIGDIVIK